MKHCCVIMKILSLGSQSRSGQAASAVPGLVIGGHGMAVKGNSRCVTIGRWPLGHWGQLPRLPAALAETLTQ